jgi:hypothetical protein
VKHPSSQALFAYWNERRGLRSAPERGDIEPGGIGRSLSDSFILAIDAAAAHPLRLAGTRICGLFGREMRGAPFETLWQESDRETVRDLVVAVADDSTGLIAGARGRTQEGYAVDLELLLLPLRHRGRTHARQIGVLAPLTVPFWLGSSPVIDLTLLAHRYLGVTHPAAAKSTVPPPDGRPRRGLVVYEGGRT